MKKLVASLLCLLFLGCVAADNKASHMDEANVFHPDYPPYMKVKLAKGFQYIDQIKRQEFVTGSASGYFKTIVSYFVSPSKASSDEEKFLFIQKHTFQSPSWYWESLGSLNHPKIVESGEIELKNGRYQYGIGWNLLPFSSDEIQFIEENMAENDQALPRYLLTKFYRRIGGSARKGVFTICYMESIPSSLGYLKMDQGKGTLTQEQKAYLAQFKERCENSFSIQ